MIPVNEVRLRGRVSGTPVVVELPSGDVVVQFRLVVPRGGPRRARSGTRRPSVDTLECAAWRADLRRRVGSWSDGQPVEVTGALHRRFWRARGGPASRYEIEVTAARRLRPTVA